MKNNLKRFLKKLLRDIGVDVKMYTPISAPSLQLASTLNLFNVDLVLDVGANTGQFAEEIRRDGYKGSIISFEPVKIAYDQLVKSKKRDNNWTIYKRCAIGAEEGEVEINIAGNLASSSILEMMEAHLTAAPYSKYIGKEIVPISTLDNISHNFIERYKKPFLKIDTQGYESKVLDGAKDLLPLLSGVFLELSLVNLYDGQLLWLDLIKRLENQGFTLWSLHQGFVDPNDFRTLQVDGLFLRK